MKNAYSKLEEAHTPQQMNGYEQSLTERGMDSE